MSTQEEYSSARDNVEIRQDFLNSIDLEDASLYVKKVKYSPESEPLEIRPKDMMMGVCMPSDLLWVPFRRTDIIVTPKAFKEIAILDDFLSCLIDHEGFHARQFFYAPWRSPLCFGYFAGFAVEDTYLGRFRKKLDSLEAEAYRHQLKKIKQRRCSESLIYTLKSHLNLYNANTEADKNNSIQQRNRKFL